MAQVALAAALVQEALADLKGAGTGLRKRCWTNQPAVTQAATSIGEGCHA